MHQTGRTKRFWMEILFIVALMAAVMASVAEPQADTDSAPASDQLIDEFVRLAFKIRYWPFAGPDGHQDDDHLGKANRTLNIFVHSQIARLDTRYPGFFAWFKSRMDELERLTKRRIVYLSSRRSGEANFRFLRPTTVALSEKLVGLRVRKKDADLLAKNMHCELHRGFGEDTGPVPMDVLISRALPDERVGYCILYGAVSALGLVGILRPPNIYGWTPSIPPMPELSINEKLLLRTLYDDRLTNGMTKSQALPHLRDIIPHLVDAVRARGVEALYQQ